MSDSWTDLQVKGLRCMHRRALYGVASSAATRNDKGTSRKISEEKIVKEEEKKENEEEEREKKIGNMVILLPPFTCPLSLFPSTSGTGSAPPSPTL